jgi:Arc/MetJ-type ribon-helix-helix transcriptional regulator
MNHPLPIDVSQAIQSLMATGNYPSEDEVLRRALAALQQREEDLAAIRAGIADMEAGRMRPLAEFDAEFRKRH